MRCDASKRNARTKVVVGVVLMWFSSAAFAATTLVGGGATSPAIGYTGSATSSPSTTITPAPGSLFGAYSSTGGGNPVSYCPVGDGWGKRVFAGSDPANFQVNAACASVNPLNTIGFGGVGLTQAHFAAADMPISIFDFNQYLIGHGTGTQPVQLPSIASAISIVFNKTGVTSMRLSEGQICGIFSGQIKTWNDPLLIGSGVPSGISGNINIVYRADNVATTFGLLNHLSAVCPSNTASGNIPAVGFKTNLNFATGASAYVSSYASSIPFSGAVGVQGLIDAVRSVDGSVGYAEAIDSIRAPVRFASVLNSHSGVTVNPSTGFGASPVPVNLIYDQAIADVADVHGRPTLTSLPTTSQCIAVVDPSDYANPSAGYPILAINYLLANAQGNGSDAAAVRGLMFSPYNVAIRSAVVRIGRLATGQAWLSNAALNGGNPAIQAKINGCIN